MYWLVSGSLNTPDWQKNSPYLVMVYWIQISPASGAVMFWLFVSGSKSHQRQVLYTLLHVLRLPPSFFEDYCCHSKLSESPLQRHSKNIGCNFNTWWMFLRRNLCNKSLIPYTDLCLWQIKRETEICICRIIVCAVETRSSGIALFPAPHPREHAVMWDFSRFTFL